jgi:redox-sensitive bicupin YhaK (pirin superfamily)
MIAVRKSEDRGGGQHGWLDTRHSFSFADYYDPRHMGFGPLRVINEDRIAPAAGFPTHPHRDMEILTWVLSGAVAHRDSEGNQAVVRPGELQRMSAGTGIRHSEFNASATDPLHLLQIWILPERQGLPPGYEQTSFTDLEDGLRLVAARDGRAGAVTLHQDAELWAARLQEGREVVFEPHHGRVQWLQIARGSVGLNGQSLRAGDGAAIQGESRLLIRADQPAELLLFNLAGDA